MSKWQESYMQTAGISRETMELSRKAEEKHRQHFSDIDQTGEINQIKVLQAMRKQKISEAHLGETTGYGYNDIGREGVEAVFAEVFQTEDALVRPQITCGTHALSTALSALLRPGDELMSPVGSPYDTLEEVIGIRPSKGSLAEYGITYRQAELSADGGFDFKAIKNAINDRTKVVEIQRSRGYSHRPSFTVQRIRELIDFVRSIKPSVIVVVDNCYGEFTQLEEPSQAGADLTVGSLIKNPGGGLAPAGGYICGRKDLVELCGYRLTAPGLGKEVGITFGTNRQFLQGLFLAPQVVAGALKGAILAADIYESLGYEVLPKAREKRCDIVQAVSLGTKEKLLAFCAGIQKASPVDSYVKPLPWDMPGYDSQVVMAAGTFVSGSSIELSADGPLKEPYTVYFQGGLTYAHAKYGILMSVEEIRKN